MVSDEWVPPRLVIDSQCRESSEGWTFPSRNPATGEHLTEIPDASTADMAASAAAAHRAFAESPWSTDRHLRESSLQSFHDALVAAGDALKDLLVAESGLPRSITPAHYDQPVARLLERGGDTGPAGVRAVITPMSSPLATALDAIGAAIRDGATIVLKPSPDAAWSALELGRLAARTLPPGVVNVVTTRDVDVAIALTTDSHVGEVIFVGSGIAGERVQVTAGGAGKRVRADLGGIAPLRLSDDDSLSSSVASAARLVATFAGQGCRLPSTLITPPDRYDETVAIAREAMRAIWVGDPRHPDTVCGPVRSAVHRARVLRYLALAESEGATFATGGNTLEMALDGDGWWIEPTVIAGLPATSRVAREEILGPVLVVVTEDDAGR